MLLDMKNVRRVDLPSFDEDGVTQGVIGIATNVVLEQDGGPFPLAMITVARRSNRECDLDGAPFSRMAVYITAWEIISKGIDTPTGAIPYKVAIIFGVNSVGDYGLKSSLFTLPAGPDPYVTGVGLLAQCAGQLWTAAYVMMSVDPGKLPPGFKARPQLRIVADRTDGIIPGAGDGSISVIKGDLVT